MRGVQLILLYDPSAQALMEFYGFAYLRGGGAMDKYQAVKTARCFLNDCLLDSEDVIFTAYLTS